MSLTVSWTVNVCMEEVSVNGLEKAALAGAREAGQKLFQALLDLIERTMAMERFPFLLRLLNEDANAGFPSSHR